MFLAIFSILISGEGLGSARCSFRIQGLPAYWTLSIQSILLDLLDTVYLDFCEAFHAVRVSQLQACRIHSLRGFLKLDGMARVKVRVRVGVRVGSSFEESVLLRNSNH